jgi:tetratricopeptide (TPR) repeat protein
MNEISQINKAIKLLSLWVNKINLSSAIDFYDINKVAENLAANLLNEIYGYQLINLNIEQRNFPAVDLGCDIKKLAFQITSTQELEKIESTLKKFVKYDLQNRFTNGVRFLFLTTDKAIKLTDSNKKKYQTIYNDFDGENHILTVQNLIQEIQVLYNKDNEIFCKILKILEREFSTESSDIAEIVKVLTIKHQQESQVKDEQIKALTHAITALSQGQGVIGTEAQINSAFAALKRGDVTEAKSLFTKAAEKSESVIQSESQKAAEAYRNLGALAFWDNTQEALNAYHRATELEPDNADGWNRLGILLNRIGKLDEAITTFYKSLTLGESHQNKEEIAMTYGNLGVIYHTKGDLDKAIEFYEKGLTIEIELGLKEGMAAKYTNLGIVYYKRGNFNKAIEFQEKAIQLNELLQNKGSLAQNYTNLGNIYYTLGNLDRAIELHQQSLQLNKLLNMQAHIAENYGNVGIIYHAQGLFDKAIEFHRKSLQINELLDIKEDIAQNYGNLGSAYFELNDLDIAIELYEKGLAIETVLELKEGMAFKYSNLGVIYMKKGNRAKAKYYWQKSLELFKQLGNPMAKEVQHWLDALQ